MVVMAGPGMLQSGLSRDLFIKWAPEKKNGIDTEITHRHETPGGPKK